MKLARFGEPGAERPAVLLEDGTRIDVSSFTKDFGEAFFGEDALGGLGNWIRQHGLSAPRVPAHCRRRGRQGGGHSSDPAEPSTWRLAPGVAPIR